MTIPPPDKFSSLVDELTDANVELHRLKKELAAANAEIAALRTDAAERAFLSEKLDRLLALLE